MCRDMLFTVGAVCRNYLHALARELKWQKLCFSVHLIDMFLKPFCEAYVAALLHLVFRNYSQI